METGQRQLTPELFQPVGEDFKDNERIAGPSIGFWRDSWQRFRKNKASLVGLVVIVALVVTGLRGAAVGSLLSLRPGYDQRLPRHFCGTPDGHG